MCPQEGTPLGPNRDISHLAGTHFSLAAARCVSFYQIVCLSVCLSVCPGCATHANTARNSGWFIIFPSEGRRPLYRGVKKDQSGETKKQCVRAAHKKMSSTPGTLGPAAAKLAYRRPYGRRRASGLHMFLIQLVLLLLCYTTRADVESVDSRYAANTRAFGERRGTTGYPVFGFCQSTKWSELRSEGANLLNFCPSSNIGHGGWWSRSLTNCLAGCERCQQCHFISFSPSDQDCSWFRKCPSVQKGEDPPHAPFYHPPPPVPVLLLWGSPPEPSPV